MQKRRFLTTCGRLSRRCSRPARRTARTGDYGCPIAALGGIIFALKTGADGNALPRALGRGSGNTCWRLRDWQAIGVWRALHRVILDHVHPC